MTRFEFFSSNEGRSQRRRDSIHLATSLPICTVLRQAWPQDSKDTLHKEAQVIQGNNKGSKLPDINSMAIHHSSRTSCMVRKWAHLPRAQCRCPKCPRDFPQQSFCPRAHHKWALVQCSRGIRNRCLPAHRRGSRRCKQASPVRRSICMMVTRARWLNFMAINARPVDSRWVVSKALWRTGHQQPPRQILRITVLVGEGQCSRCKPQHRC